MLLELVVENYAVVERLRVHFHAGAQPPDGRDRQRGKPGDGRETRGRTGIRLVGIGILAGTAAAVLASRAVRSMLFSAGAADSVTFVVAPAILMLVALPACCIPARRATGIEPWVALRDE